MYQIVIATSLGELGTATMTKEAAIQTLKNTETENYIFLVLEDGQTMFMTKEMIGRSVFFIRQVQ
jgi:hypothetical protein